MLFALFVLAFIIAIVVVGANTTNDRESDLDCFVNSQVNGTHESC